jgi:hypothetical protein
LLNVLFADHVDAVYTFRDSLPLRKGGERVASPVVAVAGSASISSFVLGLEKIGGYWYLVLRRDHGEQVSEWS